MKLLGLMNITTSKNSISVVLNNGSSAWLELDGSQPPLQKKGFLKLMKIPSCYSRILQEDQKSGLWQIGSYYRVDLLWWRLGLTISEKILGFTEE